MNIIKNRTRTIAIYFLFYSIILVISLLPLASFRLGNIASIFPVFEIAIVFFFSIYKPHILPLWLLFTYAIFIDLTYALPLGISVIPIITTSYLVSSNRQIFYSKDFSIVFIGFAVTCLLFQLLKFIIFAWYYSFYANFLQVLLQGICTIFFYPVLHYVLQQVEKVFKF